MKFLIMRMEGGDDFMAYVNKIKALVNQLVILNKLIDDCNIFI